MRTSAGPPPLSIQTSQSCFRSPSSIWAAILARASCSASPLSTNLSMRTATGAPTPITRWNAAAADRVVSSGMSFTTTLPGGCRGLQLGEPCPDQRVGDAFQPPASRTVGEYHRGQRRTIQGPVLRDHSGAELISDGGEPGGSDAHDLSGQLVGVDHNCSASREETRDSRLSRPDTARHRNGDRHLVLLSQRGRSPTHRTTSLARISVSRSVISSSVGPVSTEPFDPVLLMAPGSAAYEARARTEQRS